MNHFGYIQALCLIVVAGLFQSCEKNKQNWEIKGTSETGTVVYLYRLIPETTLVDSAYVDHRKFSFSGENADERLEPFYLVVDDGAKPGVECMLGNGDQLKLQLRSQTLPNFSGTKVADDLNKYYAIKQQEQKQNLDLSQELTQKRLSDQDRDLTMISYREKVQDLENEKIQFLKSIVHPDLNAYLVLKELQSSGVIEKEVVDKYRNALSAEGALTNDGIKVHRISDFFEAYALSREIEILDTATIRERYNKLDDENKTSVFAKIVEQHLQNCQPE
ncbi:DUF4369 domain-containing protein [Maribellus luteus]|uniref:DUF4369 domain-containing protein n=1 Tax=Maribellus luteus TaxID=2305463 RepID=A0A399SRJ0_9BACT|nr:DUF4369 domain-containing protein [Maribellus luteus]RIJ46410.1 DUF4369 domain-containing protein [Maribellus luteus]